MKLLLVEDEESLRGLIARALRKEQYVVEEASTYCDAYEKISLFSYDCILLDIMLPDGNGIELLKKIKSEGKTLNVIIISAKNSLDDKVLGLDEGADDYLSKPFHMAELLARVKSVIRRCNGGCKNGIAFGNVHVNPDSRTVEVDGKALSLLKKEYDIVHKMFIEEMTDVEIADIYKISRQYINCIRRKYKKKLKEKLFE